jgi:hypothetical protein
MATEYFNNFPSINYKNKQLKNILLRAAIRPSTIQNEFVYMPLTLQEGERPDVVANDLYNNSFYDWVIRLTNDQIDPYYDWYLTQEQFERYLISKYGSLAGAIGTIVHYKNKTYPTVIINPYTYNNIEDSANYEPVYAYDYEEQLNESKKNINVIQPITVQKFDKELEKKLNE